MKTIVWYSNRHRPSQKQIDELHAIFPRTQVEVLIPKPQAWRSAEAIAQDFKVRCDGQTHGCEMVAVLPMSLIKALVHLGFQPLYAIMKEVEAGPYTSYRKDDGTTHHYVFEGYKRITGVEITMVPVGE